jgi:hypothetical protein
MLVRHPEAANIVFHQSLPAAEVTMKRHRRHNMNTTLKTAMGKLGAIGRFSGVPCLLAIVLLAALSSSFAQTATPPPDRETQINTTATEPAEAEPKLSADRLNSLVGPIALYPDPLLIQVLAASTYPLEIIQLKQWMDENKKLKGNALAETVAQQNWDPSVQALAVFPAVVNKLANKIQWTTDLGNAFLAQESDLMDAVQALRATARENGALRSNDKQKVETESASDGKQAITIEPAQREVVYVPTYNTQYVYRDSGSSGSSGSSGYSDYSGYSGSDSGYDYSYVGYAVAAAYGAYWGYYNWRDRYAELNYNNRYNWNSNNKGNNWDNKVNNWSNKFNNLNASDKSSQGASQGIGRWQHDPSHRGSAPYGNRDLANRFGQGDNRFGQGAGNRGFEGREANAANQLARSNRSSQIARANGGNQLGRGNLSPDHGGTRSSVRPLSAGAANRVGNRISSNWASAGRGGAFGPGNGNAARAFSARGAQSMGSPGAFRGGLPAGLSAGGPMGGGFRGGLPGGGFPGGGPPMGGLPAGGPPMGGPPPPPPPPAP